MNITLESVSIERHDISTRMPFKYGIATMTHLPHLFVRVEARYSGKTAGGVSADHLPPKWFTKEAEKDPLDEIEDMLAVIDQAAAFAQTISAHSIFDFWLELYRLQDAWATEKGIPPLLAHFGTSLIERAVIDAFCRLQQETFQSLLHRNAFGIHWDRLRPELTGLEPKDLLPESPLSSITIRHTVGLADYLLENDIPQEERLDDGLPQSLEAVISFYGITHFKIKINGQLESDLDRLVTIAQLFATLDLRDFAFSLDGNEQFQSVSQFRVFWDAVQGNDTLYSFFQSVIFVEQPFHRDLALSPEIGEGLRDWASRPPIIIDESDASLDSLPKALELGYRGTSHKNCKGVFKGILNRATINFRNRERGDEDRYLMSGEDLANIGPIANHQDLVVQAALGIRSVERNGHHYFKGLSIFDSQIQENALKAFPKLYTKGSDYVRLNIQNGSLDMSELLGTPFGTNESNF